MRKIKIGNASGYWGDDPDALRRQVEGGELDYITLDFLAEVTMSIMQKQKRRDPTLGYATDFVTMLKPVLKDIVARNICVISNAGGVSPFACAEAIAKMAEADGVKLKIAIVHGDGILDDINTLQTQNASFTNIEDGTPFENIKHRLEAANIYFGALPVVEALRHKPHIIVTGRVTDTGITLAPMIHEFQWQLNDWDKLASGVVAGHILECGSQVTGGNFTDWHLVKEFTPIGYPIAEIAEDGTFTITKHRNTGGIVTTDTVREQLFYEMGDPENYIAPDVVCDFSTLTLTQDGADRVKVQGVCGRAATPTYKVSMCYRDGFKVAGSLMISGAEALTKAQVFAKIFWQRCGQDFAETRTEFCGWNSCHLGLTTATDSDEILLRLSARDDDRKKLQRFAKLVPPLILSGLPGVAIVGGAPKVQEIVSYWPALIPKELVQAKVSVWGEDGEQTVLPPTHATTEGTSHQAPQVAQKASVSAKGHSEREVCLSELCLARSGDKGDAANIGVMARNETVYKFLENHLTAQTVKTYFRDFCAGDVKRYSLPNLCGFNFILERALGGGGTKSLRIDPQGKTLAQALLRQKIAVPDIVWQNLKKE